MKLRIIKAAVLALLSIPTLQSSAQSIDEKIAGAMNSADWFTLYSIHSTTPKDSINSFLEVFSRCLIGNRLNRHDISIPAFEELFTHHTGSLDLNNYISSAAMYAKDLNFEGENLKAAEFMNAIHENVKQLVDSATLASIAQMASQYSGLAAFSPYGIEIPEGVEGKIGFRFIPVGPKEKESILIHLNNSSINDNEAEITFDTGAGVNIISDSLAKAYNLIPIEANITVKGIGEQNGYYAIAKEMRLGNINLTDVPFCVIDINTLNQEANKYIDKFSITVGSDLMLRLKELTIDFRNKEIIVPANTPERSEAIPNLCFSTGLNLLAKGSIMGDEMVMTIDTGDASFGSLGSRFFEQNKEYITTNYRPDTIRTAGIGGAYEAECYNIKQVPLSLGNNVVTLPEITVITEEGKQIGTHDCNLGLKSLMQFEQVNFNLVDFTLTTSTYNNSANNSDKGIAFNPKSLEYVRSKEPNIWQILGRVAIEATREYMTHH